MELLLVLGGAIGERLSATSLKRAMGARMARNVFSLSSPTSVTRALGLENGGSDPSR